MSRMNALEAQRQIGDALGWGCATIYQLRDEMGRTYSSIWQALELMRKAGIVDRDPRVSHGKQGTEPAVWWRLREGP